MSKILEKAAQAGDLGAIKRLLLLEKRKTKTFMLSEDERWKRAFFVACANDHCAVISLLLRYRMKGNSCDGDQKSALMYACEKGSTNAVKLLLKKGGHINLDACDSSGRTALMFCCQNGHFKAAKLLTKCNLNIDAKDYEGKNALVHSLKHDPLSCALLINRGIHIDACDREGRTVLMQACICGDSITAFKLILKGASVDARDKVGNTALIYAAKGGHDSCVVSLISQGHASLDIKGEYGKTALIHAVLCGHSEMLDMFCEAKVSIMDDSGTNALMHACVNMANSSKIVAKLIQFSILDTTLGDMFWYDILVYCCKEGCNRVVSLLLKYGIAMDYPHEYRDPKQPLMFACEFGHSKIVNLMVNHGVNTEGYQKGSVFINASAAYGKTALMYACANGFSQIVRMLTQFAVNVAKRDVIGKTALIYACEAGHVKVVTHLLSLKAENIGINALDDSVPSANGLMHAVKGGHMKVFNTLLEHGADVNICNKQGENVFMLACKSGSDNLVRILLKTGINVSHCSNLGKNALMCACEFGHETIVRLLLNHQTNSNVNLSDKHGLTALIYAAKNGHVKIVDLLIQHNADVNRKCESGFTAFLYACLNGCESVISSLMKHEVDFTITAPNGSSGLDLALRLGYGGVLPLLIRPNFELNGKNRKGRTALILACQQGNQNSVKELLSHGNVDVNVFDDENTTALMYACLNGYDEIVAMLVKRDDLDVNAFNDIINKNTTALMYACLNGYDEIVAILIKRDDLKVNASDFHGKTALIHASQKGYDTIVNLLVCHNNIDIDIFDHDLRTSLMYACMKGFEVIVKTLIGHGASCATSSLRNTPLSYALKFGHKGVVDAIMTHICDASHVDYNRESALVTACGLGYEDVVKRLLVDSPIGCLAMIGDDLATDAFLTPLSCACKNGREKIVNLLFQYIQRERLDINSRCLLKRKTALMFASEKGSLKIVELLIRNKAKIYAKDDDQKTALMHALASQCYDVVSVLLQPGDDVDSLIGNPELGETALMFACSTRNLTLVNKLLELSVKVNAQDLQGKTALMQVCERGDQSIMQQDVGVNVHGRSRKSARVDNSHEQIVRSLLEAGADVNIKDMHEERTALMFLCVQDCDLHQLVDSLIQRGYNCNIDAQDKAGKTALMHAIENGNKITTEHLIQHSVNLDTRDKAQKTALFYAAEKGYDLVLNLLARRGVDLNACDRLQKTPLMYACQMGHLKVVKLLMKYKNVNICARDNKGKVALMHACKQGHEKVVKHLICNGNVNIDECDFSGKTCLIQACKENNDKIVEILLDHGADDQVQDEYGQTALSYAFSNGYDKIFGLLISKYPRTYFNSRQNWVSRPMILACTEGYHIIVDLLIEKGASVNTKDSFGKSVLMYSCQFGHARIVKALVNHNRIDVNASDEGGVTALMYACMHQYEEIVELLLNHQVNVNACDGTGQTALMYSCERGHTEVVRILLRHKANVNAQDQFGRTAFSICCPCWQPDIIEFLSLSATTNQGLRNKEFLEESRIENRPTSFKNADNERSKKDIVYLLIKNGLSVNALPRNGQTAIMFAMTMPGYKSNFLPILKGLLDRSDVNLDGVDKSGDTVFSYAMRKGKASLEALLLSGKLLNSDGDLNIVHRNAVAKISGTFYDSLLFLCRNGIFDWNWCKNLNSFQMSFIGLEALDKGYCPGWHESPICPCNHYLCRHPCSPMISACSVNNKKTVRFFFENLYFFPEDYYKMRNSRHLYETFASIDGISASKPLTLESLSFLSVSKAISRAGPPTSRSKRVDALPLPALLKSKLKFEDCDRRKLQVFSNMCYYNI